mmetsp:Transcript_49679/g.115974  ORF Transcript_49679/g.115974 Transcript_49679/m.115974 type:complete len:471 (+) Transcript_49679:76-1488(+)
MSCCEGLLCGTEPEAFTEVIRPEGFVQNGSPKVIDMLYYEQLFGYAPLIFASYPALALRMPTYNAEKLKSSLAKTLQALPICAGRFRNNGNQLVFNGEGVPFQVVPSSEASAPEVIQEKALVGFADFCRPASVRHGRAPLMTIKLTTYKDGSAVMCMCRSHMLFDGTSVWTFLNYWAGVARGEAVPAPKMDRDQVYAVMPAKEEEMQALAEEVLGKQVQSSYLVSVVQGVCDIVTPIADTLFLHAGVGAERQRVFISDQEVADIKAAATPVNGGKDSWVSTQEALTAFLLQTLAKELLPSTSAGKGLVTFLLDPRKSAKVSSDQLLGCGLSMATFEVPDLLNSTLSQVAAKIHEEMRSGEGSDDKVCKTWRLLLASAQKKAHLDVFKADANKKGDIMLQINNSSKRILPDFGAGRCTSVLTNAGPTLFLPAKGGIDVYLDNSVFRSAKCYSTAAQAQAAEAVRKALPKKA